jgi:LmbE family N-acetylglucosaminyl deacetylase
MGKYELIKFYHDKHHDTPKDTILIVAAHPDDEILGAGGTIAILTQSGYKVCTFILGEGKTSRSNNIAVSELDELKLEMVDANRLLGVTECYTSNLPDNRFDSVDLLDIVQMIEKLKEQIQPVTIFTHHFGDMNIDHQITYKAVLTATRPMQHEYVKNIYTFEIPSSTEWNTFTRETVFTPNVFIDISSTIDTKISAMSKYASELREYPHPRSLQHVRELAKVNGTKVGLNYCENFTLIRSVGKELL